MPERDHNYQDEPHFDTFPAEPLEHAMDDVRDEIVKALERRGLNIDEMRFFVHVHLPHAEEDPNTCLIGGGYDTPEQLLEALLYCAQKVAESLGGSMNVTHIDDDNWWDKPEVMN